jgi:hypothetical protein
MFKRIKDKTRHPKKNHKTFDDQLVGTSIVESVQIRTLTVNGPVAGRGL